MPDERTLCSREIFHPLSAGPQVFSVRDPSRQHVSFPFIKEYGSRQEPVHVIVMPAALLNPKLAPKLLSFLLPMDPDLFFIPLGKSRCFLLETRFPVLGNFFFSLVIGAAGLMMDDGPVLSPELAYLKGMVKRRCFHLIDLQCCKPDTVSVHLMHLVLFCFLKSKGSPDQGGIQASAEMYMLLPVFFQEFFADERDCLVQGTEGAIFL